MDDPDAAHRHQIVMTLDSGHELTDLIGAVPTRPPKPSMKSVLRGPRGWLAAHAAHRSSEPGADLVRRICNQADVYGDAATDLGAVLGDAAVTAAAADLKQAAKQLWSNQIDAVMLRSRAHTLTDLITTYRRLL